MRILLAHVFDGPPPFGRAWMEGWLRRISTGGVRVAGINTRLPGPDPRLSFAELDRRWRRGDRLLMDLYERVAAALGGCDVLINYGGVNLHPDFLAGLSAVTALGFFDDPESSADVSRPIAAAHDICLVGNVAELETYRAWGVPRVAWWPMGFREDDYDPGLTRERILEGDRPIEVALLCERRTHWRRRKVDTIAAAFPQGVFRGAGWPLGFLPEPERVPLLQRTRIGINIHNSTGPINFRTFYLPANGVLQLCDNRAHLGRVFELGTEVVGFETVAEAIELCRYYLAHDDERRELAVAGWERTLRDYNERAAFDFALRALAPLLPNRRRPLPLSLAGHRRTTRGKRMAAAVLAPVLWPVHNSGRVARGLFRRGLRWLDTLRLRAALTGAPPARGAAAGDAAGEGGA